MHIGDIHGHLVSRPDALGGDRRVGGVARIATVVERIRRERGGRALLVNVGDALQGSAEALFTRGQAVIDVLSPLRIDAFIPGNWDFTYGIDRFVETFVGAAGRRSTRSMADGRFEPLLLRRPRRHGRAVRDLTGERVLPAFLVRDVGGVRVADHRYHDDARAARLGHRTDRQGLTFSSRRNRARACLVTRVRGRERADVVVVASELELANNVRLAGPGDARDRRDPFGRHARAHARAGRASAGTVIVEEGQDARPLVRSRSRCATGGSQGGSGDCTRSPTPFRRIRVSRGRSLSPASFLAGEGLQCWLTNPLDRRVARGADRSGRRLHDLALHRRDPLDQPRCPRARGVVSRPPEDALSRGHRCGRRADSWLSVRTAQARPGPITRADLYHWLPIGAQVAVADEVPGRVIWRQLESSLEGRSTPIHVSGPAAGSSA